MIKTFCDVCEEELTEKNSLPRGHELKGDGKVKLLLRVGINELGKGHICKYCAIKAVADLDDRPKMVKPAKVEDAKETKATSKAKTSKA